MATTSRLFGVEGSVAIKTPCRVATTGNITLSGLQIIDGVTVEDGDRVLVRAQTDATENGVYSASAFGWSRTKDFNGKYDVVRGTQVFITQGVVNGGNVFYTTSDDIQIGETDVEWGSIDFDGVEVLTADTVWNVPTDYASLQDAADNATSQRFKEGSLLDVNLEAGQDFDASELLLRGDLLNVRFTADDATVSTPVAFPGDDYLVRMDGNIGAKWATKVDMAGLGRGGVYQMSGADGITFMPSSGVINAGGNGSNDVGEDDDPVGFAVFVEGRASFQWDEDTSEGAVFDGAAGRGLWVTYGGIATGKYVSAQNTGSDPAFTAAHAAAFVSRGAIFHVDNFNASGSAMGVRVARGVASFRDSTLTSITRHAVAAFEGGIATGSRCDVSGSGQSGHGILVSGNPDPNRPQGGGIIEMEKLTANNVAGDIAVCYPSTGKINIDNLTASGVLGAVAVCSGGLISARFATVSAGAASTASQLIQSSNAGEVEILGGTWDAGGYVDHIARVADGGHIYMRGSTLSNAADTIFDFGEGMGFIHVQDLTIDGTSGLFEGGVVLGPQAHFTKLSDAEFAVQNGFVLPDGNVFFVKDQMFEFAAGATALSGLPGVKAVDATLEGFGAVGDGMTDNLSAIQEAVTWMTTTGGKLTAKAGNTYLMSGTATASGPVNFDATGATFVSSTGARLFGFDAPNTDGPYALTADYVEGATSISVADTGTALTAGTMIKIHSDAVDAANRDEGSDTSQYRTSEWAVVSEGSTTTNVILERPLRFVEGISPTSTAGDEARVASYTTAMNAKIIVQDMETPFSFVGGTYKAASGAGTVENLIRVQGYHVPRLANFVLRDGTDTGLAIPGTTFAEIDGVTAINCDQYGLALNGHAPKVTNFTASKCRHGFTQIAGRATANNTTISTLLATGRMCGGIVNGFTLQGYFEEQAADLHQGAEGWTITNGYIEGAAKAIQNRGRGNKWSNIKVRNCGQGVLNLTEYDGGDTDDDFYTAGKTQADFSSATFTDMDIECTSIPFENRSATMTLGGTIRIRSADHTSVYNNGGHVTNTGHIDHVVTEPGGDVGRSVIRVVDPVAAVAGVFPDDASLFVNDGQIVVDATAGTVGLDAFKIDSGSKFINRGLVSVDTPTSGSSFLNGGIMPEIAAGKIIYREAGVVTEVYKQEPVFVEDFGDTETADDSALAINRAIQFVSNNGGGEVNFQGGKTYLIDTSIQLRPGVTLRGHGAIVKRRDNAGVFDMVSLGSEGDDFACFGLTFDGNRQNQADQSASQNVIELDSSSTSGVGGDEPNSNNFTFEGCKVINYSFGGMGLHVKGFRGVRVSENFFDNGGDTALYNAVYLRRVAAVHVTDNRFGDNVVGQCIKVQAIDGNGDRVVVTGNMGTSGTRAVHVTDSSNYVIANNVWQRKTTISDTVASGIVVVQDVDTNEEIRGTISGNVMENYSRSCLRMDNQTGIAVFGNYWGSAPTQVEARDVRLCHFYGNTFNMQDLSTLVGDGAGGWVAANTIACKAYSFEQGSRSLVGNIVEDKNATFASGLTPLSKVALYSNVTTGDVAVHGDHYSIWSDWTTISQEDATDVFLFDRIVGTFTPEYVPASGAFDTITYDQQDGTFIYDRLAGVVDVWINMRTDAVTVGAASGAATVSLPYTSGSLGGRGFAVSLHATDFSTNPTFGYINPGTASLTLRDRSGASSNTNDFIVSELATGANANSLQVHVRYPVA